MIYTIHIYVLYNSRVKLIYTYIMVFSFVRFNTYRMLTTLLEHSCEGLSGQVPNCEKVKKKKCGKFITRIDFGYNILKF